VRRRGAATAGASVRRIAAWAFALLLGIALAAWLYPPGFVFPAGPAEAPRLHDLSQHIIGQRYFIRDAWHWPPVMMENLSSDRLNVAFVDGIPALALVLKALAPLLPEGFHGIGLWYALAALLQPVAAVWALRGAGETRLWPAIAVALIAASMPAWLARFGHAALTGHFLILVGLGLYLRLLRRPRSVGLWSAATAAAVLALLVHPYLAAMVLALLAAVPASLLLRRDRSWTAAALWAVAPGAAIGAVMLLLGYLGASGGAGFGDYAMNLLSPVWPAQSWLLGAAAPERVDATGLGGWEGYNFLGFGVLGGLAVLAVARPQELLGVVRRHAGLALVLGALTLLALSHRVGLGGLIVLDLGAPPQALEQFRASGRFFWPVGYALAIGAVLLLARWLPGRIAAPVGLLLALVQAVDATGLREATRAELRRPGAWTVDAEALRPLLAAHRRLTLLPTWHCVSPDPAIGLPEQRRLLDVLLLASETAVPASTMYVARWHVPLSCNDPARATAPLAPGELRLLLPTAQPALLPLVPGWREHCRPVGALVACSAPEGSGPGAAPELPLGVVAFRPGEDGAALLYEGFGQPEDWAVWSVAPVAVLRFGRSGDVLAPLVLDVSLRGYGPRPGAPQSVEVVASGVPVARWELPDWRPVTRRIELPAQETPGPVQIAFRVQAPTRPADRDRTGDLRTLGFALQSIDVSLR
jgi:hypothetical protein